MKKWIILGSLMTVGIVHVSAQETDKMIFNHVGIGFSVGTTALGINVSTVLTPHFGIRGGINMWPIFKLGSNLHLRFEESANREVGTFREHLDEINERLAENDKILPDIHDIMDVKVKPKLTAGHVLFDYYPFPTKSSFHLTAGAHFGTSTVADVHNRHDGILMPVTKWNRAMVNPDVQPLVEEYDLRRIGLKIGEYWIAPDEEGNLDARIRVAGFRPYLGWGFGRAVPRRRIGCQFDLGVQLWGKPRVFVNGKILEPEKVGDELDDILSLVSRITVFPVLNFRLVGKIF